jgi:hypothetical protein
MNAEVRRKLAMAGSVQEFCLAHPTDDPSYAIVLARLKECIVRAGQLAKAQLEGHVAVHSSTAQRKQLRRAVHDELRHLARVTVVAAKTQPELVKRLQLPSINLTSQAYQTAARAALDEGLARRDLLLQHGMAVTLLDDLTAALTQYDAAVEQALAGRRTHVGAAAELEAVAAEIMDLVRLFDGLNRYRFRENADLRAAWASARNIVATGRGPGEAGGGNGPAGGVGVKPAA